MPKDATVLCPAIVVTGNPVDGFTFYGPFPSGQEAVEWADNAGRGDCDTDWWVAPLTGV